MLNRPSRNPDPTAVGTPRDSHSGQQKPRIRSPDAGGKSSWFAKNGEQTPWLPLYFTFAFRSLPAVNLTVLDALIFIGARVLGLIPVRAFRVATLKVPKPTSWTD
jgi:hypothetical protein